MLYADNENKIIIVINRGAADGGALMNAVTHCCAGLFAQIGAQADFLAYESPAGGWCAQISRWPIIVLTAKNSGQLARLVREAQEQGVAINCFTAAMLGESAARQQQQVLQDQSLEYWVVAAYGGQQTLRDLTRRFSLYKGAAAA